MSNIIIKPGLGIETEGYVIRRIGQGAVKLGEFKDLLAYQEGILARPGQARTLRLNQETSIHQVEPEEDRIDEDVQGVEATMLWRNSQLLKVCDASGLRLGQTATWPTLNMPGAKTVEGIRYDMLNEQYGYDFGSYCTCGMHLHVDVGQFVQEHEDELLRTFRDQMQQFRRLCNELKEKINTIVQHLTEENEKIPFVLKMEKRDLLTFLVQDWLVRAMNNFAWELQALSANSPFVNGQFNGRYAERLRHIQMMPRHGMMPYASAVEHLATIIDLMWRRDILNPKELWFCVRAHPFYTSVEIRALDMYLVTKDGVAIVGYVQPLAARLLRGLLEGGTESFAGLLYATNQDNITYSAKNGLFKTQVADVLVPEKPSVSSLDAIKRHLDWVMPEAERVGSTSYIRYLHDNQLARGTGANLQIGWFGESGGVFQAVERKIVAASYNDLRGMEVDWEPARRQIQHSLSN